MNSTPFIIKNRLIQSRLAHFTRDDVPGFQDKWNRIRKWQKACAESDLRHTKETQVQGLFMVQVFEEVLGYATLTSAENGEYNQKQEYTSRLDTSEADGALGFFSAAYNDVRAVIELKDAACDLDKKQNRASRLTPVEQAFSYANKNGRACGWVIVSNFVETRLYRGTSSLEYERFKMSDMDDEAEFLRFYYFLSRENLLCKHGPSVIDELYRENEAEGQAISARFYREYRELRNRLFVQLKEHNAGIDELTAFAKAQKIMDRFLFICFCEDCGLLPANIYVTLIETSKHSFSVSPTKIWDQLRGLFQSIDRGNPPMSINRYNGGLFRPDPVLDALTVPDEILESLSALSRYDFESDLNVNILGQIFEQSIADVEHIKAEIEGEAASSGKRKDDGIFYTPYYVTRYIVEQTVGAYLADRKEKLKTELFADGPVTITLKKASTRRNNDFTFHSWCEVPDTPADAGEDEQLAARAIEQLHLRYWSEYENALRNIKVCDPACGSGAFLNQCFDYLREEMDFVLDMKRLYSGGQIDLFDIDKEILQNNLYGVDINPESVEITKLSLWLKTAKRNQTLASLDDTIKCGNSIVADASVSPAAFDWRTQFPSVFAQGGFDVVIGNPPYGARLDQAQKDYLAANYETTEYNFDTYKTFFELGLKIVRDGGYLGYITPNTFFKQEIGARKLRKYLFDRHTLLRIVELFDVFPDAIVEPLITVFQKAPPQDQTFSSICVPRRAKLSSTFLNAGCEAFFIQSDLKKDPEYLFNYRSSKEDLAVCEQMKQFPRLETMFDVMAGAKPYEVGKGTPPQTKEILKNKPYTRPTPENNTFQPYMRGKSIGRFVNKWAADKEFISYGPWIAAPRKPQVFAGAKIFIRRTDDQIFATLNTGDVGNNSLHLVYPLPETNLSLLYLLGLLNSTLMNWYYRTEHYLDVDKPLAEIKAVFVKKLPIAVGTPEQSSAVEVHVTELLSLCQAKFDARLAFLNFIQKAYEPKALTERLENFETLSFKDFCAELKKQKVRQTASQQMELLPLFEAKQAELADFASRVKREQKALDDLVFALYGIDDATAVRIKNEMPITL